MKLRWIVLGASLAASLGAGIYFARGRAASEQPVEAGLQREVLTYEQANGQQLYQVYCLVCHGAQGEGDGFNAFNLNPRPRDFIEMNARNLLSDQDLIDAIRSGGARRAKSGAMPGWGHTLSERQLRYVAAYVRTLKTPEDRKP